MSEASLFLEATRSRSRALIQEPPVQTAKKFSRRNFWFIALGLGLSLFLATGAIAYLTEIRIRRLEESLSRSGHEARLRSEKLQSMLKGVAEFQPIAAGFDRIHAGFERLDRRLEILEKSQVSIKVDPGLVEVRESLTTLRKEVSALEKGNLRQAEDLRVTTLEIARLLRLLVTRSQPVSPEPVPDFPNPRRP